MKEISWLNRIILSFPISIGIVPLIIFGLNYIGIKITVVNVFFEILSLMILSLLILLFQNIPFINKLQLKK